MNILHESGQRADSADLSILRCKSEFPISILLLEVLVCHADILRYVDIH